MNLKAYSPILNAFGFSKPKVTLNDFLEFSLRKNVEGLEIKTRSVGSNGFSVPFVRDFPRGEGKDGFWAILVDTPCGDHGEPMPLLKVFYAEENLPHYLKRGQAGEVINAFLPLARELTQKRENPQMAIA